MIYAPAEQQLRAAVIEAMVQGSEPRDIARKVLEFFEEGKVAYAAAKAKNPCAYCECMYPCGVARTRSKNLRD